MLFLQRADFSRCSKIVREKLQGKNIVVKDVELKRITEDIMNFSYAKGGDYSREIVGAGQIWYHDGLHVDIVRDNYIGLGEDGSFQDILWLEKGINPKYLFYKVGVGGDPTYFEDVSEEEWNEITQPFFEMVENNAVPRKTLKEVFGDLLEENTNYSE